MVEEIKYGKISGYSFVWFSQDVSSKCKYVKLEKSNIGNFSSSNLIILRCIGICTEFKFIVVK
jgi:hypothetical protein